MRERATYNKSWFFEMTKKTIKLARIIKYQGNKGDFQMEHKKREYLDVNKFETQTKWKYFQKNVNNQN